MKRHILLITFALIAVTICAGTLHLTSAGSASVAPIAQLVQDDRIFSRGTLPVLSQGRSDVRQDVDKILRRYDVLEFEPRAMADRVRSTGAMRLPTSTGPFDIELAPYDMRAPHYRAEVVLDGGEVRSLERTPVRTYKGSVRGKAQVQARLTIDENTFEGVIITPNDLYFVEPARKYSSAATERDFLFYKGTDVIQSSFGECGVTLADKVSSEASRLKSQREISAFATGAVTDDLFAPARSIDLATDADFEYFSFFGNATAANNEILSIMNSVEGIYNTQFGIQFTIVFQNVWGTSNDPYTTSIAEDLLVEFLVEWNDHRVEIRRDLAHLWTGKNITAPDLSTGTIGIAFRPGLECPLGLTSYGLSERLSQTPQKIILSAHEIGHNLDASHTDEPSQIAGCENTIMQSSLSSMTQQTFCTASVNQIDAHANANVACLTRTLNAGCTYTLSAAGQKFPAAGGSSSVNVTTTGSNCLWGAESAETWITINSGANSANNGTVTFTVAPNNSGYGRTGVLRIAEQNFMVTQDGGSGCAVTPISFGQTINANIALSDCQSSERVGSFADQYSFGGQAGQQIKIEMSASGGSTLDTYVYLIGPITGPVRTVVTSSDDIELGVNTNSRVPLNGFFSLPATGAYLIEATSFGPNDTGNYAITLSDNSASNNVSFSSAAFSVNEGVDGNGLGFEGTGSRTITVSRSGDVSGAATVDFATSEGTADERRDYTIARGTLRYGPGETSKSFPVLITDDRFKPGDMARSRNNFSQFIVIENQTETVNLTLSNPVGTSLGGTPTAVLTINDNDSVTGTNPASNETLVSRFFVRQQYMDFLNREPDLGGLGFWAGGIDVCGGDLNCRKVKSIDTSAAFFLAIEFQETGFVVHRANKAAFGDINPPAIPVPVRLSPFLAETRRIQEGVIVGVGDWAAQLEANKVAYFNELCSRPQFLSMYSLAMTSQSFVDTLNTRSGNVLSTAERDALVAQLESGARTRAQVVRAVAEDPTMVANEFNRSFVLMQYFGYMRRNPDDPQDINFNGFTFWLTKLNQFNGDFRGAEMVKAFIESIEYLERFGP
ncbi:MAG TPA: M12 family metallo-peptidase [Pyrinomonadaceae bacterium]|nr:M12 family metallo-peptidase [Pyrinomonadaceae bacterium]